jgi:hypothetical protein
VNQLTQGYLRETNSRARLEILARRLAEASLAPPPSAASTNPGLVRRFKFSRVNMFGRLLGLYDPLPEDGVRFFLNALSGLHEGDAGFRHEHNEGTASVTARTVLATASDLFAVGGPRGLIPWGKAGRSVFLNPIATVFRPSLVRRGARAKKPRNYRGRSCSTRTTTSSPLLTSTSLLDGSWRLGNMRRHWLRRGCCWRFRHELQVFWSQSALWYGISYGTNY